MRLYITALWESCTSALRWWKAELESGCRLDHLLVASSLSAHPLLRSKSLPLVSYNMSGKKGFKFFQRKLVLLNETNAHSQRYSHHFTKSMCFFQHFFHKDLVSDDVKVCSISQILNTMLHVRSLKHIYTHTPQIMQINVFSHYLQFITRLCQNKPAQWVFVNWNCRKTHDKSASSNEVNRKLVRLIQTLQRRGNKLSPDQRGTATLLMLSSWCIIYLVYYYHTDWI